MKALSSLSARFGQESPFALAHDGAADTQYFIGEQIQHDQFAAAEILVGQMGGGRFHAG